MESTPKKKSTTPSNETPSVNEDLTNSFPGNTETPMIPGDSASRNSKTPDSASSSSALPALTHEDLGTATIQALRPYCVYWSLQEDWNKPFSDYIVHALNGEDVIGYIRFILFHRLHNGAEFKQIQSDYDSD